MEVKGSRVWLAIVLTALGCPGTCGGAVGNLMGEGVRSDGSIGPTSRLQFPLALILGIASIASIVICIRLLDSRFRPADQRSVARLVRIAGLYPLLTGISLIVAGGLRIGEGLTEEGWIAILPGLALSALGVHLGTTRMPTGAE